MAKLNLINVSLLVFLTLMVSCEKDDNATNGNSPVGGGGDSDSPWIPPSSDLFDIYENDIVANDAQNVLDLSGATDPNGSELTFIVESPFEVDAFQQIVKFESGYIIDADVNENPNLLEPQDRELDFTLTVENESGVAEEHTYTLVIQDLTPDWNGPTGE